MNVNLNETAAVRPRPRPRRVFDASNACGATVYDVDTRQKLEQVMSLDIDSGQVVLARWPLRVVGEEIETYTVQYRSVHPIYGGRPQPQLFHCYGRITERAALAGMDVGEAPSRQKLIEGAITKVTGEHRVLNAYDYEDVFACCEAVLAAAGVKGTPE